MKPLFKIGDKVKLVDLPTGLKLIAGYDLKSAMEEAYIITKVQQGFKSFEPNYYHINHNGRLKQRSIQEKFLIHEDPLKRLFRNTSDSAWHLVINMIRYKHDEVANTLTLRRVHNETNSKIH